jgi:sugar O-acyltransferase (sialic acid O-acetyltransferase NeuD family)
MPTKSKKLVIVGDSAFAEIAHAYFEADTAYEVAAYSVEAAYLKRPTLHGLPVVAFESLAQDYPAQEYEVYVAVVYTQLNRLRTRLMSEAKRKGYRLASYISPRAFVWRDVQFGEHCFVFEDNTVQPFVQVGNNVVLWSGNHIGHHSVIRDNCFISSHVAVSGFCDIGENCFIGVNAAIANNVKIARNNWIGPGVTLLKDTAPDQLYAGKQPDPSKVSSLRFFKAKE